MTPPPPLFFPRVMMLVFRLFETLFSTALRLLLVKPQPLPSPPTPISTHSHNFEKTECAQHLDLNTTWTPSPRLALRNTNVNDGPSAGFAVVSGKANAELCTWIPCMLEVVPLITSFCVEYREDKAGRG
jgi:hypothetical protein